MMMRVENKLSTWTWNWKLISFLFVFFLIIGLIIGLIVESEKRKSTARHLNNYAATDCLKTYPAASKKKIELCIENSIKLVKKNAENIEKEIRYRDFL